MVNGKRWPKLHIPLEPHWDQPSSWPHGKRMQTGLLSTVIICNYCNLYAYRGSSCKRTEIWSHLTVLVDMLLSCFRVCPFRVVLLPPADSNLALPALMAEPPHDTVQDHCEALASCVSSLAMAVWTAHILRIIAPYPNHPSVFHSLIHW